jgi:hypothetical protein
MKGLFYALCLVVLSSPLAAYPADVLIPAGSLIQCTVSEPKLSSKTVDVGDPVLCQISHFQLYGRPVFPYGSYLAGQFKEYKDPGHFVGKGWMELDFNRVAMPPDQEISLDAKVVQVTGYPVDKKGRIDGKGHPVRDTVEWSIPILWPIDLINLPRRGPRPVLKPETMLTLKVMDDVIVPGSGPMEQRSGGLVRRAPMNYAPASPSPSLKSIAAASPLTVLITRDGNSRLATQYWFENGQRVVYVATNGIAYAFPIEHLDLTKTIQANRERGVNFVIRSQGE